MSTSTSRKRVWHDPEDDKMDEEGVANRRTKLEGITGMPYQDRLIQNFEMVYGPTPKWAQLDKKKKVAVDTGVEDDKMDFSDSLRQLSLGKLEVVRVENLNSKRHEGAVIRSVDFHPQRAVGLVAGNSCVSLYQVNGSTNPHIQSITFGDFPIRKAQFSCKGDEIFVSSGLMDYFYCYDMHSGSIRKVVLQHSSSKFETVRNLVPSPDNKYIVAVARDTLFMMSNTSKELVHSWSVNNEISGVSFSPDGREIFVQECTGGVYRWNVNSRRCVEKFSGTTDFNGTCLSTSSKFIACGSSSGYVSIFENTTQEVDPIIVSDIYKEPLGELKNLTNAITQLKINCTEEILAMGSVEKDNAIRLVHLPTRKTFPNFPAPNANYGRCNSVAFSPNSGYIATGSNRGCAYLFRLKHYTSY